MKKRLIAFLFFSVPVSAMTTASVVKTTAQQAILTTITSYSGTCSLIVSTSSTYSPTIDDLDGAKFSGANLDSNSSVIGNKNYRVWTIGKRGGPAINMLNSSDMRRYPRSLYAETLYYWQETCGSEVVSGTFMTTTIKFGTTYADPRYDRSRPGESNFPTLFYTTNTIRYADPYTGAQLIRASMPGDMDDFVTTETFTVFKSTLNGVGWTVASGSATYSGTSQNAIFIQSSPTTIFTGTDNRDVVSVRFRATIKGTASAVNVCMTADGESCIGGTITQSITSSPVAYIIGTSTPMLESWRNGPTGFLKYTDLNVFSGNVTVLADSKTVTLNSSPNPPYFNVKWSSGSQITIGTNVLNISSNTQVTLTLSSTTLPGSYAASAQNFGFLVWDAANTNDTITISTATYLLEAAGSAQGVASGSWQICDPLQTIGPTGPGTLCYLTGRARGFTDNVFIWIGQDGTVTSLGQCTANITGTGLSNGTCFGQVGWDVSTPGKYYIVAGGPAGTQVVASVTYQGNYTSSTTYIGAPVIPSTATIISGDINTMVHAFDATFSTTNFIGTDWQAQDSVPYGVKGAMILINDNQVQNTAGWFALFDLNTNTIIAAGSTFLGVPGKPNRWFGLHGISKSYGGNWIHISAQDSGAYYVGITSNTFNANYVNCPANSFDPTVVGQPLCTSTVIVSTDIPNNGGTSFYGIHFSSGDTFALRDNGNIAEKVRVMTVNGLNVVFERCLQSYYFASCGDHTHNADTWDLQVAGGYKTGDINWDFVNDPHAQGIQMSYGSSFEFDPNADDCHEIWGNNFINAACTYPPDFSYPIFYSYPWRNGPLPNFNTPLSYTALNVGFAGDNTSVGNNIVGSHPSITGTSASQMFDTHPLMGLNIMTNGTPVGIVPGTKNIWRIQQTNTFFNYRIRPFVFFSGEKQLADVSPTIITDTPSDYYKFCVTITAGDCFAGSSVGDVYADLPFVSFPYGNGAFLPQDPYMRDLSIGAMEGVMDFSTQMLMNGTDFQGANVRMLTTDFRLPRVGVNYDNGRQTVDGNWYFQNTWHNNLFKNDYFISKIPSIQQDTKSRWTYMKVPITVGGKSGDTVRLRFGYMEYGTPSQLYCSPRQMQCSTDATGTNPYLWSDETQQWTSCGTGCSINLPVLPGHIAYYVIDRKNGSTVTTSPLLWTTGE